MRVRLLGFEGKSYIHIFENLNFFKDPFCKFIMKNQLELNFQYYRFWAFSLLALTIACFYKTISFIIDGNEYVEVSTTLTFLCLAGFVSFMLCFQSTYKKLKATLPEY